MPLTDSGAGGAGGCISPVRGCTQDLLLESVSNVRLPVPYQLRPAPYQGDIESGFISLTP